MAAVTYTAQRGLLLLGDEKGAWLADTTEETITGSELVTNGDFATDTDWTKGTGWAISSGVASCDGTQTADTTLYQSQSLVAGETYVFEYDITAITAGSVRFNVQSSGVAEDANRTSAGSYSGTFVYSSGLSLGFYANSAFVGSVDNLTLRLAVPDLSASNNGVGVYGSIIKSSVATGAELVAYSEFSSSNYLERPANTDLDFGTGDFGVIGWADFSASVSGTLFCSTGALGTDGFGAWFYTGGSELKFRVASGATLIVSHTADGFHHYAFVRSSGIMYAYVDGILVASEANASNADPSTGLHVGAGGWYSGGGAKLSMMRIFDYATTAAQIEAIYESEKHLFKKHSTYTQVGEPYSFDLPVQSANPSISTVKTDNVSLGGVTETVVDRDDDELDITTGLLHRTDTTYTRISEFQEFMYGTRASESFTLDLYGSVAVEDEPETYIRVGQHSGPTPESNMHNWFRGSFKARKL